MITCLLFIVLTFYVMKYALLLVWEIISIIFGIFK